MRIDPTKIEAPKEEIDAITKKYNCSETDAVRAFLNATEATKNAYANSLARELGSGDEEPINVPTPSVHTPAEIKNHLDQYVIGQEDYKKRLSIASAYNFAVVHALNEGVSENLQVKRFRKKNTIISGPSGSGKTYCAEILGDFLEVPTLIIDSTDYTEAGYVGKSADDMVRELIQLAPGQSKQEKAGFIEKNGGIIFVDEIDKKAKDGKVIGHDISREGFQRAVLKLIERKLISVEDPMSPAGQIQEMMSQQRGGHEKDQQKNVISTENILFILGGSFQRYPEDLESIVKKRIERGEGRIREDGSVTVTGFVTSNNHEAESHHNFYREAGADDYISFGLIPELVGRAPVRTYVNALSKNDLIRIMTETRDSIVEQYKFEFKLFGIDLDFSDDALMWIAERAENQKTGARALISVFENMLTEFQFELPGRNFTELKITKEICESPKDAVLAMLARSPLVDFIGKFKRDHGIDLVIEEEAERKIEEYAKEHKIQVSTAIEKLLSGASALNYMNWQEPFIVTAKVIDNPAYFDEMYVKWHQKILDGTSADPGAGGGGILP